MRNRAVGGLAAAALVVGAAAGAGVATAYDDSTRPHDAMMGQMMGAPTGRPGGEGRDDVRGHGMGAGHHMGVASERAYLVEMIAHHEEAIEAAGQLDRSDRAAMRRFGARIVASQSAQVEQMEQWLAEWYPDRGSETDYEPMMRDLDGLSGDELDRAFLEDMVGHHMGAVMMSHQLLMGGLADHDAVARLAQDIADEQHREIVSMQRWLRDWYGVTGHGMGGHGMGMPDGDGD